MVALSVLLLTRNGSRDLERLLPALYAQESVPAFEVIAVDSGSTDGTLNLLKTFPLQLERIPSEAFHHACTRNSAATLARGEILVFLSQDAIPTSKDWLRKLISNFDDPNVGAVYGRQIAKPGSAAERQDTLDTVYGTRRLVKDPAHHNGLGYRFYHFSDANSAIRRSVWQQTRFPENLKVFEDLGIAKRILDSGWKIVYDPEASVYHSHNYSSFGLFKRYFDIGYTLKLLKIWEVPGTRKSLCRDAWKLISRKVKRARDGNSDQSAWQGIRHDIAKSFGFFLGLNEDRIPISVKRHLSAFRVFG